MICNLGLNKIIWAATAALAIIAGLVGVLDPNIYQGLILPNYLPGTVSQDLMSVALSLVVLALLPRLRKDDLIKHITILGIIGYLFYAYGIYVIEQMYNAYYLFYLAIFGLSFYSLIYSLVSIDKEILQRVQLPKGVRYLSAGWSLINPMVFYPLWIRQLLPLMESGAKGGTAYSIYILDISFVMPAFIILAVMTLKNRGIGLLLTPALFIKGFTLLYSVALGTQIAPLFGKTGSMGEFWFYFVLATSFLALTLIHLRSLQRLKKQIGL